MDVDEAAAELYALAPADFTARRTALAKQAKQDGAADVAKEIGAFRRPTVSAWALNRLAADEDDVLEQLFDLAEDLRAAQAALDAARMGELSGERRRLVRAVQQRATETAEREGLSLSPAAAREVEETMAAVVASEEAADAVASGRLTRALSYAGFGDVDLSDATATPRAPRAPRAPREPRTPRTGAARRERPAPSSPAKLRLVPDLPKEDAATRRQKAAEQARAAATEKVSTARETVQEAESRLAEAQTRSDELAARVQQLQHDLAAARTEAVEATRAVTTAERRHASAKVALGTAERTLRTLDKP